MASEVSAAPTTVRVGKRGVLVIPADLRERVGIEHGTLLAIVEQDGGLLIRPVELRYPADARQREAFLREVNESYAIMERDHPDEWRAMLAEQDEWDGTLLDGLDPDERWTDDGDVIPSQSATPE